MLMASRSGAVAHAASKMAVQLSVRKVAAVTAAVLQIRPGKLLFHSHKGYFGNPGMLNGCHDFGDFCINDSLIGI